MAKLDITVDDHGSIFMFTPISKLAREWVEEHLRLEGWQWLGASFAVEHRFARSLAEGMAEDGLVVG
jgi:hypothetical protein